MQNPQTTRRRRAQVTPQQVEKPAAVKRRQKLRKIGNAMAMLILAAVVVLLVIICPKEPVRHAYYTIGTDDNQVVTHGVSSGAYSGLVISEVMASNRRLCRMRMANTPTGSKSGTAAPTTSTSRMSA